MTVCKHTAYLLIPFKNLVLMRASKVENAIIIIILLLNHF